MLMAAILYILELFNESLEAIQYPGWLLKVKRLLIIPTLLLKRNCKNSHMFTLQH